MGYRVAISDDFFTAFANLPKSKQNRVMEFMSKFRSNPMSPGMNYEKINNASDKNMRSVRIDDTYRAIVMREEGSNVFLLLWVDHHDEAYAWAVKKRCVLNHSTGSIQVYDMSEAEAKPEPGAIKQQDTAMFTFLTDEQLKQLGVPDELLLMVRAIYTDKNFSDAQKAMPVDAYQALCFAKEGFEISEIVDMLYGTTPQGGTQDMAAALDNPVTKMKFMVVEGEEELKAAMNAPLDKWRIFLHPSQRRIVSQKYNGPAKVLGGAGTGKTVVAMHRAQFLASRCADNERILFTTFTANLAQDIKENLRKICSSEEMKKIEVIHLDAWVNRFLDQQNYTYTICYGDELDKLWEQAKALSGESFDSYPEGFFKDEWRAVVQAQGINTLQEYAIAQRNGRGVRLNRKDRIAVWKVFEEYRTLMDKKRIRDNAAAMNECCQIMNSQPDYHPYKHIIVDESQDFGMVAFRLLRTLAGEVHENDLFIVGDAHQRIYRNKVVLSKCRVDVRGRSSRLKINYRTTEEIRNWAMHVLTGISFDDLDDGKDSSKGYRSLSHGDAPIVEKFDSINAEIEALIAHIKEETREDNPDKIDLKDICVVTRVKDDLKEYMKALNEAGIKTYEIKRSKTDDRGLPGVRMATMHRVKGLEFESMFLVGMTKSNMPYEKAIKNSDPETREELITSERCLFYVALTRAKKIAHVSGYGKMSEFVNA